MKKLLPTILFITLGLTACGQSAEHLNNEGNEAFASGDYEAALTAYQNAQADSPDLAEPYYNAANVYYRQEDYEQTKQQIQQALLEAQHDLAQNSLYNLGNTFFNTQQFQSAIEAYKEALRLNPHDTAAKHNLELALRHLQQDQQQQQKQQEERQEDSPEQQQDDQQQDQPEDPQEQQQENQEQDQSDQQQEDQQNQQDQQDRQDGQQNEQQPQEPQQGRPQQIQSLTPEQARQLFEAAAQDTESIQEHLQQIYIFPGDPPAEDW